MENKTPIKRSKYLIWLSRDHHDGLLIVWKIRQGIRLSISGKRIIDFVVNAFEKDLTLHFLKEEQLLFSRLSNNDALRLRAEDEHAAIRKMVAALPSATEAGVTDLEAVADLLEAHIRFEERTLFPYMEKELAPEELELIGSTLEDNHSTKNPFLWQDEFWTKEKV